MYSRYDEYIESREQSIHENSCYSECPCASCYFQRQRDKESGEEQKEYDKNNTEKHWGVYGLKQKDNSCDSDSFKSYYISKEIKCQYCKKENLTWKKDEKDQWRLYDHNIKHECRKGKALGKNIDKVFKVDRYSDLSQMTPTEYYLDYIGSSIINAKLCIFKNSFKWYILTTYRQFSGGLSDGDDMTISLCLDLKWREWNMKSGRNMNKDGFDNEHEALKVFQIWRKTNDKIRIEYE